VLALSDAHVDDTSHYRDALDELLDKVLGGSQ
jgi:hypothetical protein